MHLIILYFKYEIVEIEVILSANSSSMPISAVTMMPLTHYELHLKSELSKNQNHWENAIVPYINHSSSSVVNDMLSIGRH